jgi:uncharacterized protein (TIGR02145 family)
MKKILFIALSAMIVAACGEDEGKEQQNFEVTSGSSNLQLYADDTEASISFVAKQSWTASADDITRAQADWIELSQYSGEAGSHTLTMTLDPNETGDTRKGVIRIGNSESWTSINITQSAQNKPHNPIVTIPDEGALINGLIWAKYNVGSPNTFTQNPEDFGMLYQWGQNVGWSATGDLVSSDGSNPLINELVVNSGDLWPESSNPCPAGWRIPMYEDWLALDFPTVDHEFITLNNVEGILCTDRTTQGSIFIPAANYRIIWEDYDYEKGRTVISFPIVDPGSYDNGEQLRDGLYWSGFIENGSPGAMNYMGDIIFPGFSATSPENMLPIRCVYKEE